VRLHADEVRGEVAAGEYEILDDHVHRVVDVLHPRDGHVADLVDERRRDDGPDVAPEVGLELERTLRVEEEVVNETLPVLTEALVERVVTSAKSQRRHGRRRSRQNALISQKNA
jgi:hypothetical protein